MIEIDGSYGEGGGQVLRTALTLAAVTGQPTHVRHIRAGRRNPGLAPQHLTGVAALAQICDAQTSALSIGCTDLVFAPRVGPRPGDYMFDVAESTHGGSAGAVSLVLQTVLLPLARACGASRVVLRGGTHVPWSPPFEYLEQVYLPALAQLGYGATCRLDKWGFYPAGGGQITVEVHGAPDGAAGETSAAPAPLTQQRVERGALKRVHGQGVACNLPAHVAQRIVNRAHNVLNQAGLPDEISPRLARGPGPGAYLWLLAEYEHGLAGFCALGERGKPSERVADEACQALLAHHAQNAPVDAHLADQQLLPLALTAGRSEFHTSRVTAHLITNAYVIRQFVPASIEIAGEEGEPGNVVVDGVAV